MHTLRVSLVALVIGLASCANRSVAHDTDRRVEHNAELEVEVDDPANVEDDVRALTGEVGGFVAKSESIGSTLMLTVRVPDSKLDEALARLARLGRVESRRLTANDVTDDFVDLEAQRVNLTATRDRLLALLQRAATATEALEVNRALDEVQGRLEQVQGRLAVLGQRVSLATISATFSPRAHAFANWRPLEVASAAFVALGQVARTLANVAIVLAVFAPLWAPVAFVIRRRRLRVSASPARAP